MKAITSYRIYICYNQENSVFTTREEGIKHQNREFLKEYKFGMIVIVLNYLICNKLYLKVDFVHMLSLLVSSIKVRSYLYFKVGEYYKGVCTLL